ncbi:thymidylate kinase-domain-containing protein [Bisporella sp. PMI_857]|nr:thymidylate kinase-domain-containing protein [Bisporella sp. PMI_857]
MTNSSDTYPWQEPATPVSRGAFIVIEGIDRAGKTTQVKKLCDALYASGRNVRTMRFPDRSTAIGKMIDGYLRSSTQLPDQSIHLLFSANRWELASSITESLLAGYTIICDRYIYSGAIYSASKLNPLLPFSWAYAPEVGLPKPDLVVYLDLSPENTVKRGGYGDERYEKKELQEWVRSFYVTIGVFGEGMEVVNAGKGIDEVAEEIKSRVTPYIERFEGADREEVAIPRIEARDPKVEEAFMQNVRMMHDETLGYGTKVETTEQPTEET